MTEPKANDTVSSDVNPQLALLFPGQGSQVVGMGRAFYDTVPAARAIFQEADDALGFALSRLIFEGPEDQLKLTEHTQPAILTTSIAILRALSPELKSRNLTVAFAAGHSLGEYSAHVAAGTFTFADAVRTVRSRGRFMQAAAPAGPSPSPGPDGPVRARGRFMQAAGPAGVGAMAAILGLPAARINDICA